MTNTERKNQCSVYGENWAESMPPNMVETAIENGKIDESCRSEDNSE
ncbi:MAG: hypothetical protein ABEJ95_01625 [Candidatus Nanohalobium sp.]